jgi:hypothetical protein
LWLDSVKGGISCDEPFIIVIWSALIDSGSVSYCCKTSVLQGFLKSLVILLRPPTLPYFPGLANNLDLDPETKPPQRGRHDAKSTQEVQL